MKRRELLASTVALAVPARHARRGSRILFLGDSITYAGHYVHYLDAWLRILEPRRKFELIGLGLPSEGVTGLTERDHPFPRPNVHDRLDRALAVTRPDEVVACYGMNDGIYAPFDEARFARYRDGIERLCTKVLADGARLVLATPPPFDARPLGETAVGPDAGDWGWRRPFRGYDGVLSRYGEWLLGLHRPPKITVVNAGAALRDHLRRRRLRDPSFYYAADGVHLDRTGHALLAAALLPHWNKKPAQTEVARAVPVDGGFGLRRTGAPPPPWDEAWDLDQQTAAELKARLGGRLLSVRNAPRGELRVHEGGDPIGVVSGHALEGGFDCALFPLLSLNRDSRLLRDLVQQAHRLSDPAWLSHTGHTRPGIAPGLPVEEALAQSRPLQDRADQTARARVVHLEARSEGDGQPKRSERRSG